MQREAKGAGHGFSAASRCREEFFFLGGGFWFDVALFGRLFFKGFLLMFREIYHT